MGSFGQYFGQGKAAPAFDATKQQWPMHSQQPWRVLRAYLTHPTFNRYHAEHEMLRYLRSFGR